MARSLLLLSFVACSVLMGCSRDNEMGEQVGAETMADADDGNALPTDEPTTPVVGTIDPIEAEEPQVDPPQQTDAVTSEPVIDPEPDPAREPPVSGDTGLGDVSLPDFPLGVKLAPFDLAPKGFFLTIDLPPGATVDRNEISVGDDIDFQLSKIVDAAHGQRVQESLARLRAVTEPVKVVVDSPNLVVSGIKDASGFVNAFNVAARIEIDGEKYIIMSAYQPEYDSALTIAAIAKSLRKTAANRAAETRMVDAKAKLRELGCEYKDEYGSNALFVSGKQIMDEDLAPAADIPPLRWLEIVSANVTPGCLKHLARAPSVETVHLTAEHIDGTWLEPLREFPALRSLIIEGGAITRDGWQDLSKLTRLDELKIRIKVDAECIKAISQLPNVSWLEMKYAGVDDEMLKGLTFKTEEDIYLYLSGNDITDASLEYLQTIKNLESLTIKETKVTEEGVRKFKAALPGCDVDY